MFSRLKTFIADLTQNEVGAPKFNEDDFRLAATALMVHAIEIDGITHPAENKKLRELLKQRFQLGEQDIRDLIARAEEKDREAIDLYGFTSVLTRKFDQEDRQRIVLMLWEIVLADEEIHEFEDNFIWRVAELLGLSTRDRITLRKQVEAGKTDNELPFADEADTKT